MTTVARLADRASQLSRSSPGMSIPQAITAAMREEGMKSDAVWCEVQRELSRRSTVMTARRHAAAKLEKIEQKKRAAGEIGRHEQLLIPQLVVRNWWEAGR